MHFYDFEKKMIDYPVFTAQEARNIFFREINLSVQISQWVGNGYLKKIKKGLYILSNREKEINPMALAEKIYSPSYLSLEYALNYYGIIPDIPGTYTSVSSRKTMNFKNDFGYFSYQKIKPEFFTGYQPLTDKGVSFALAYPEKAIMDYIYFNKNKLATKFEFWEEMRINEDFKFDKKRIEFYKKIFHDKKIDVLVDSLLKYQKNAR